MIEEEDKFMANHELFIIVYFSYITKMWIAENKFIAGAYAIGINKEIAIKNLKEVIKMLEEESQREVFYSTGTSKS